MAWKKFNIYPDFCWVKFLPFDQNSPKWSTDGGLANKGQPTRMMSNVRRLDTAKVLTVLHIFIIYIYFVLQLIYMYLLYKNLIVKSISNKDNFKHMRKQEFRTFWPQKTVFWPFKEPCWSQKAHNRIPV